MKRLGVNAQPFGRFYLTMYTSLNDPVGTQLGEFTEGELRQWRDVLAAECSPKLEDITPGLEMVGRAIEAALGDIPR